MTDTLQTLGKIITTEQQRDSVHIAVAPVVAAMRLAPGQEIGLIDGEEAGVTDKPIGIVDPFLKTMVQPGQRFWLYLYPGSISSLVHHWTHPAFEDGGAEPTTTKTLDQHKIDSEKWLREYAVHLDIGYNALIAAAERWVESEEHTVQQDRETWRDNFDQPKEFWHHYEIVTGTKVEDHEATFFCCSC